jgi:hypothetical protein
MNSVNPIICPQCEQLAHRCVCYDHDHLPETLDRYLHAEILDEGPNRSKRPVPWLDIIFAVCWIVTVFAVALILLLGTK